LASVVRGVLAGVRDRIQGRLPRIGPHSVPAVGDDTELAIVSDTGVRAAYSRLSPVPDVPARSFLALARYTAPVADVSCPTLFVAGSYDDVTGDTVESAADDRPDATLLRLPSTHLDLLDDERTVEHTLVFLDTVLG
jgi:pimeloyl-ACP methyl ester carboxylesterase